MFSFSAEIYRLSADKSKWIKVHPEILSLRLNNNAVSGSIQQQQQQIALLEAATLEQQVDGRRSDEQPMNTILSLPILQG
jgi:hypothetical protein